MNRRFIFVDRSGTGRFELFRPIWDERNRMYSLACREGPKDDE